MGTPLTKIQKIARDNYANGEFAHFETHEEASDGVGDTLFEFIMRELEDCDSRREAVRRMETAKSEIKEVIEALRRA
jgi:hypothetical protein